MDDDVSEESTSTDVTQRVLPALIKLYKYNDGMMPPPDPITLWVNLAESSSMQLTEKNHFQRVHTLQYLLC